MKSQQIARPTQDKTAENLMVHPGASFNGFSTPYSPSAGSLKICLSNTSQNTLKISVYLKEKFSLYSNFLGENFPFQGQLPLKPTHPSTCCPHHPPLSFSGSGPIQQQRFPVGSTTDAKANFIYSNAWFLFWNTDPSASLNHPPL